MAGILVSFWDGLFSGAFAVSFREGSLEKNSVQLVFLPLCFQTFGKHAPKAGGELEARLLFFPERGMV